MLTLRKSIFTFIFFTFGACVRISAADGTSSTIAEKWEAIFLKNVKAGYAHTWTDYETEGTNTWVHVHIETNLSVNRFGKQTVAHGEQDFYETKEGRLVKFTNKSVSGGQEISSKGQVSGTQMKMETHKAGLVIQSSIPWPEDVLGPYAEERRLALESTKDGGEFEVRIFITDADNISLVRSKVSGLEQTNFLGEQKTLRKIESQIEMIPDLKHFTWLDKDGRVVKTFSEEMGGLTRYCVGRDVALNPNAKP